VTGRELRNVAASVHQRLLNQARATNRPFSELLQYFAMERFLYRLSKSPHAETFILKGALMLTVWEAPISRPTLDIDVLGQTDNEVATVVGLVQEVCRQEVEPDGLVFDPTSAKGENITEDVDYHGVRVRFLGSLGRARISMQFDVGFGDVVFPSVESIDYPTILDLPVPRLSGYSRESTVAEKLEAMTKLGLLNSRMKDFFDIWLLSQQFDFDGETLAGAVVTTFATRGTDIPSLPMAMTTAMTNDASKITQWQGFIRRNRLSNVPDFGVVVDAIGEFLLPVLEVLATGNSFKGTWKAPGPWLKETGAFRG